ACGSRNGGAATTAGCTGPRPGWRGFPRASRAGCIGRANGSARNGCGAADRFRYSPHFLRPIGLMCPLSPEKGVGGEMTNRLLAGTLAVLTGGALASHAGASGAAAEGTAATPVRTASARIVIAHRGASAYRPEHTLAAYETAIRMGADYIEPDLVPTADGVLVARHENEISETTDVAERPEFADRRTTKTIDGRQVTGWFTEDFTLAELKTLRARERVPGLRPGNTAFDGLAPIPTFEEVVELALRHGVGVYPETKHPTYFRSIGLPLEEPLLETLERHGVRDAYIQSFETANLRELSGRTRLPLIQLIRADGAPWDRAGDGLTYDDLVTPAGLEEIAGYARGIGVDTRRVLPIGPDGRADRPRPRRPPRGARSARVDRTQRELPAPRRPPARRPGQPPLPARHRRRGGLPRPAAGAGSRRRVLRRPRDGPGRRRAGLSGAASRVSAMESRLTLMAVHAHPDDECLS